MPIIRTEKKNNFTVIDNCFLRDKELSLKAKGLLAAMLSLPEEWVYSVRGLAAICKEHVSTVRSTLSELEAQGYLTRECKHDAKGRFDHTYYIHEKSVHTEEKKPHAASLHAERANTEELHTENETLLNKEKSKKEKIKKEGTTTDLSYLSAGWEDEPPLAALTPADREEEDPMDPMEGRVTPTRETSSFVIGASPRTERMTAKDYRDLIAENTDYYVYASDPGFDKARMMELIEIAAEAAASTLPTQRIGGDAIPTEEVRRRMLQLKGSHMEYVMECYKQTTTPVRNPYKYLLASLYHAPTTIDAYYEGRIRSLGWW